MATNSEVVDALKALLSSTYMLYTKTQKFHWNVTGPMFTTLHTLFETEYTELAMAVDEIAERIRALGEFAPGSYAEFNALSVIAEEQGNPKATDMIEALAADQDKIVACAAEVLKAASDAGDDVSGDLAIRRTDVHQKNAWMLRSHLE